MVPFTTTWPDTAPSSCNQPHLGRTPPSSQEPSRGQVKRPPTRCKTCTACRVRKVKCDGGSPHCGSCGNAGRRCVYPQDARYQNKPTRAEIQRLEAHIDSIWEAVREREAGPAAHASEAAVTERPTQATRAATPSPAQPLVCPAKRPETENPPNETERSHQDLSPAEMDIVGVLGQDGELVVHGVSSMHYDQHNQQQQQLHLPGDPRTGTTPEEDEASSRQREQRQQVSKARLVANAAFQRQRESVLLRNPSVTQDANFGCADPDTALHLLDIYFNRIHFTYLFSYRPAIMDSLITKGPYCNVLLLAAVYFSSSTFSDRAAVRAQRDQFYSSFRLALVDHIDKPSVPSAVGLLLCSAALVACGRLSAGWVMSGMAYRMMLDLGCHFVLDCPRRNLPDEMILLTDIEVEMRKRLYWGGYLVDATQSLYLGRPPYLRTVPARVPQVFLDTYEELDVWAPYVDTMSASPEINTILSAYAPQPAYAVSTFMAMLRLLEISSRLVHSFYNIDSLRQTRQIIRDARSSIEENLGRWYESRPKHLRFNPEADKEPTPPPHQLTPLTTYHTLTILLHRPFLANRYLSTHISEEERAAGEQTSIQAAVKIYHLLQRYHLAFTMRRAPYLISYAAHSALLVLLAQDPSARDQVLDKISFLWCTLGDLQGGGNYGLKKPIESLSVLMAKLGMSTFEQQGGDPVGENGNASDSIHIGGNHGLVPTEQFSFGNEGGVYENQWSKFQEHDLFSGSMDCAFPNSGLDGVNWLLNDISWVWSTGLEG
ncbi:fungal-specific transcription factor domain-containing protein [Aspergillus pseudoustus]|uniref:Fungal-specific transcription factor domain-containing protein n=1 Tax=Aspergillus pseudoustus TaxID=1810923 RepID=A0ABR4IY03_9EURO